MKYITRALKYYLYLMIILAIVLAIAVVTGFAEANINDLFKNGWTSLGQIALIMGVFSAIYPMMGYKKLGTHVYGSLEDNSQLIDATMERLGYVQESCDAEKMTYIKKSLYARVVKSFEDRITINSSVMGLEVEGLTRDLVRVVSALEATQKQEND